MASAGEESLRGLSQGVRRDLDAGKAPNEVIDGLAEAGWDKAFLEWYVLQVAAGSDELTLQAGFAAYPRGSMGQFKESAEDITLVVKAFQRSNLALGIWLLGIAIFLGLGFVVDFDNGAAVYALQIICQSAAIVMAVQACLSASRPLRWNRTAVVIFAVIICLIPCGAFLFLVSSSSRLQEYLRKAGIKVGLFGPNPDSVRKAILARTNAAIPTIGPDYVQR